MYSLQKRHCMGIAETWQHSCSQNQWSRLRWFLKIKKTTDMLQKIIEKNKEYNVSEQIKKKLKDNLKKKHRIHKYQKHV